MRTSYSNNKSTRREFLKKSGAVAATTAFAGIHIAGPAYGQNLDPIRVGVIGCGGRGTGACDNVINAAPNVEIVAMADAFEEQVENCINKLQNMDRGNLKGNFSKYVKVSPDSRFVGFDAYKKVIDHPDVNYIMLATPPGFRPMQFEYAVNAGKNIFTEKPVAVDPVGIRRFMKAGELSNQKGLKVVAGTQRRHQAPYLEIIKRIHNGDIGELRATRAYWNTGGLWYRPPKPGDTEMHAQMRNWYYYTWICGDHIVEQHVHNLDVSNWAMQSHPVKATGIGGRQVRTDRKKYGHIYDHFTIDFEYPNGVHMMSMCRQQDGTARHVGEGLVGSKGEALMRANLELIVGGKKVFRAKYRDPNIDPYVQEHTDLIDAIRNDKPLNESQSVAEATMTAILGRESAYTGQELTWDEVLNSDLDLSPKKYEWGPIEVPPVPTPGKQT